MPEQTRLDGRPGQEHRAGGAVVGTARTVLLHAAAELAEAEHQNAVSQLRLVQVVEERFEGARKLAEQAEMRAQLLRMRVVAPLRRVEDPRVVTPFDQAGDQLEAVREPGAGVAGRRRPVLGQISQPVARGIGVESTPLYEGSEVVAIWLKQPGGRGFDRASGLRAAQGSRPGLAALGSRPGSSRRRRTATTRPGSSRDFGPASRGRHALRSSSRAVCQIAMLTKCDRLGLG